MRTRPSSSRAPHRPGFTLLETSLAIVIIAVGVLAIIETQQTLLRKNAWSTHSSTATFLANEIRELTQSMPRHDTFSGGLYFEDPVAQAGFRGWGPEGDELTLEDFDDLDDFDGVAFGDAAITDFTVERRLAGPVSGFRDVIEETTWSGVAAVDEDGEPIPMRGWTQFVLVEKVDPADITDVVADEHVIDPAPASGGGGTAVDEFPIRVTVIIYFQDDLDPAPVEAARVSWVVPPP